MPRFRCKKCGRMVNAEFEVGCDTPLGDKERYPECCGQPMIEIMDY